MDPEHDPLEARLYRALATAPTADAASRLHGRVAASMRSHAVAGASPRPVHAWRPALAGVAAAVLVLAAVGASVGLRGGPSASDRTIPASWPRSYADIPDLAADADLVVEGTVRTIATDTTGEIPQTRAGVEVSRVLRGATGGTVEVLQTGGTTATGTWVMEGDPPMGVGEHALLFLRRIAQGPRMGSYFVLGGPQGRFEVSADGTIAPVSDTPVGVGAGTTVDQVARTLVRMDQNARATCRSIVDAIPLVRVRSWTPSIASASTMSGDRISAYLRGTDVASSSSPVAGAEPAVVCLIDGDFRMLTPGPPGHADIAERLLVVVTNGEAELWRWTSVRESLPTLTP